VASSRNSSLVAHESVGGWLGPALALGVLFLSQPAKAQVYSIDWFKLAGGGGTSTSAVYSISSTIGQHDAGTEITNAVLGPFHQAPPRFLPKGIQANSAHYSLISGFWAIYALQTPGAPRLRIFLTSTNTAVVAWPAPSTGWTPQVSTDLSVTLWQVPTQQVNVVGEENQILVSPPLGESFFRLRFTGP
jgi:hypothetical protein